MASGINGYSQAVGTSGTCANTVIGEFEGSPNPMIWESKGSVHDLGDLRDTVNTAMLGSGTVPWSIRNRGGVTGRAVLPGNSAFQPSC
jgi:hypothetical protein